MERYKTPGAFRAALEQRLKDRATETAVPLDRLRRRVVFERLLARLEHSNAGHWIVKGAMALEVRSPDRARRTKDLDLALRGEPDDLHALIADAVSSDPFEDYFMYEVFAPTRMATDDAGAPAWRFPVEVSLDDRRFDFVKLDVVQRIEEISETARMTFPSLVAFAGLPSVEVEVVEPRQHFAEKLHAFTRIYGDRPNTRVKDLPDMVLLIEGGLAPDAGLYSVVGYVFGTRNTQAVPEVLPDPPAGWEAPYESLASDMDIEAKDLNSAVEVVRAFWATTVAAGKE